MADFNQIVSSVAATCAGKGVNSDITALTGLTTPLDFTFGGSSVYVGGTSAGTANAQTVASTTPTSFTLTNGKRVTFIAGFTNTGPMTLNVSSTGAISVYRMAPVGFEQLTGGELRATDVAEAIYDGTRFQLVTRHTEVGGLGPLINIASAATTDLGTLASHNANITGNVTITSFGSTASTTYPLYRLSFAGALTLTYNSTSLITPGQANITTAINDTAFALYLGSGNWQIVDYQKASGAAVVPSASLCGAIGLIITNNGLSAPNTQATLQADTVIVANAASQTTFQATSLSRTISWSTVGVDGLDAGSIATNTWYHIHAISNGSTTAGIASTSATAPVLPAGYIYSCRLGAMRTDNTGSGTLFRTSQLGSWTQQNVVAAATNSSTYRFMGLTTSGTYVAFPVANFVPPTATEIHVLCFSNASAQNFNCSPNNTTATGFSVSNPSIIQVNGLAGFNQAQSARFLLEGTNVFGAIAGGGTLDMFAIGWKDKVNAN